MIRHLPLLFVFASLAHAEEATSDNKAVTERVTSLPAIEAHYAAFKKMAEKHQGQVRAEVWRVHTDGTWIHDPALSQPRLSRTKTYLVFKIIKVLSGPMVLEDPATPMSLLLEEKIFEHSVSSFGVPQNQYGYHEGQIVLLHYALGIANNETGAAKSKLAYQFTVLEKK